MGFRLSQNGMMGMRGTSRRRIILSAGGLWTNFCRCLVWKARRRRRLDLLMDEPCGFQVQSVVFSLLPLDSDGVL